MRVILSRKGFDAQYGGQPSLILPDGTLLSLPIPESRDSITFQELYHDGQSYWDIIKTLNPKTRLNAMSTCHLDPDLDWYALPRRSDWRPLFGQQGAAQGHLAKCGVQEGDLFLFFGTFRLTETRQGKLVYQKGAPVVHMIFGYLQAGKLLDGLDSFAPAVQYHPHAHERFRGMKSNCIYQASERLGWIPDLPGAGMFRYHKGLQLTKQGFSKSRWEMPDFFRDVEISYHSANNFTPDYFQSTAKGQEFVVAANEQVKEWAKALIKQGCC